MVTVPQDFSRKLLRGERPVLLVEADATDPAATSATRSAALLNLNQTALDHDLRGAARESQVRTAAVRAARARVGTTPKAITQYNIVPGLIGVVLTMTMVMMTVARDDPRARARHDGKPARDAGRARSR